MSSESSWVDFTAGWISGGVSTLAVQPVDTILTRMQANASIAVQPSTTAAVTSSTANNVSTTAALRPTNIFRGMISNFGISSLWRGSSAMIGAVPVQNAVLMTGYGYGKRWTENNDSTSSNSNDRNNVLLGVFIGGTIGGILQSFIMSPIELIKVSQQVIGKSVSEATTSVLSGLLPGTTSNITTSSGNATNVKKSSYAWRGLGATLLRDGIPHGVWFVSYEFAKVELTKMRSGGGTNTSVVMGEHDESSSTAPNNMTEEDIAIPMLSGAFAATAAWGVGYPFDLIKTRIQAGKSTGIIRTARDIMKESSSSSSADGGRRAGFYGLYRGFGLKLLRSIPASAIGFLVYETAAKALSRG